MSAVSRRLRQVYKNSKVIKYNSDSKFIIMSDCHRGQGNTNDNFSSNQIMFFAALEYYYKNGYTYIELGDGDELWENRSILPIIEAHSDAFWIMSQFYKENRLYMLYGNHDIIKKSKRYTKKHSNSFYCEATRKHVPLFPEIEINEGIILKDMDSNNKMLLVHGHQGSFLNETLWRFACFLVRYVWGPLELVGFVAPTGSGRPHKKKEKIEREISSFANEIDQIVIAGHTHRPVFPSVGEGLYFNDGSCVHPRCITGIEIFKNKICLIKWSVTTKGNGQLFVAREILEGPTDISDYF